MYLCRALTVKASKTSGLPLRGWYPRCTNFMNFGTVSSMSSLIFSVIACLEGRFTKPEKFRNQTPYISLKAPQWPKFTAPCCWRQRIARFWTTPLALCLELSFFLIVGVQHRSVILPYQSTKSWLEKMETTQWTSLSLIRPEKPSEPTSTSRSCIPNRPRKGRWLIILDHLTTQPQHPHLRCNYSTILAPCKKPPKFQKKNNKNQGKLLDSSIAQGIWALVIRWFQTTHTYLQIFSQKMPKGCHQAIGEAFSITAFEKISLKQLPIPRIWAVLSKRRSAAAGSMDIRRIVLEDTEDNCRPRDMADRALDSQVFAAKKCNSELTETYHNSI